MPQKPSNLDTLKFTLELLRRIPRTGKVTARDLHAQMRDAGFDRSLRTVQRQLGQLAEALDLEVDERSDPFGYCWKPRAQGISLPGLNEQESLLLTLAEQHLAALLPSELVTAMNPFFEQARRNLLTTAQSGKTRSAREWLKKVRVASASQPLLPPTIRPGIFDAVSTALYHDCWLNIGYRNTDDRLIEALVMPLGLIQQGSRLYLWCRFENYRDDRRLALHRLERAERLGRGFTRPTDLDLSKIEPGRFGFAPGNPVQLSIRVAKKAGLHLLESRLSDDQTHTEEDDHYRIQATVTHSESLIWWLRGFGSDLEVIAPVAVAQEVAGRSS